uniref:Protein kinase domain-containing protein n=1 Tax=Timspurckia oligopyrenoides TaxID=708627 RepID=A0A7S1ETX7_9RHOD|mmetsp:Transcript_7462/g.13495  ORF Transcript_7462/g.13495 Transcript_7462/m.13495 type:complete len:532 (+) Transcript_7462:60-1655(+)|eukprot:CAMPEP_0182441576 /NCGR_PEP_ID=MMETSP1172-20130603/542_1 /TAXON_ID=708627 /ORGANISM="Timspurckia oligopyrenoides, Strain CCMP3278" /LENGTH=531 /DNA_ID=CAMNT_0024635937 /DNA_START=21 /DNA_END=1616 /DNA_ORIENTATION=-
MSSGSTRFGPSIELAGYADLRRKTLFFMKRRLFVKLVGTTLQLYPSQAAYESSTSGSKGEANLNSTAAATTKVKVIELEGAKIDHSGATVTIQPKIVKRKFYMKCANDAQAKEWAAKLKRVSANELESYYKLGKVIGVGSYGEVKLATDLLSGATVAVKTVQRGKFSSAKEMEFIEREIEVMKTLEHPHIIKTYNIFDAGSKVHFVMEYLPGGDLFDAIAEENNFSELNAAQIIGDILDAVSYLHKNNICHRDLKPENILCLERKWPLVVKLTDFGTAFDSTNADELSSENINTASTATGSSSVMSTYVGTPYYMAPEQMRNLSYSYPVDVWACGIILFAMLAGRLPWEAASEIEYTRAVQSKPLEFPPAQWADISENAKDLIRGMLEVDPKKRMTAEEAREHEWLTPTGASIKRINTDRSLLTSMGGRQWMSMSGLMAREEAATEKQKKLAELRQADDTDDLIAMMSVGGLAKKVANEGSDDSGADEMHAEWKHDQEVLDILNEDKSLSDLGDKVQEVDIDGGGKDSDQE